MTMGQRVNIQYSVELDELQDEVTRLFNNAIEVLELNPTRTRLDKHAIELGTGGLEQLERLRLRLSRVDIMLGDIQNIVEGYVRFKTQPPPERETPFQPDDLEVDPEILQDKISKFKELLNENANQESPV